jgi:hypothetical protein
VTNKKNVKNRLIFRNTNKYIIRSKNLIATHRSKIKLMIKQLQNYYKINLICKDVF